MADLIGGLLGYMRDPRRTQQMQALAGLLTSANERAKGFNELNRAATDEFLQTKDIYGPKAQQLAKTLADAYNPIGLTVFHGSPAKFSKFDPTKIGSGEGAQAYGYGHYVAEAPETAQQYKEMLKSKQFSKIVQKDRNVYDVVAPDGTVISEGTLLGKAHKAKDAYDANVGSVYEIDLPDEQIAKMLDWDKPLSQQPEEIKKPIVDFIQKNLSNELKSAQTLAKKYGDTFNAEDLSGRNLYQWLTENQQNSPEAASNMLRQAGVPGIRYLDEASRSNFMVQNTVKGKPYGEPVSFMTEKQAQDYAAEQIEKGFGTEIIPGTSNFVVFPGNEGLLTILKRNGGLLD